MVPVDPGSEPPAAPTVPPSHSVTLYHADGCHLCERALEVVQTAQARTPFTLELVDIGGVAALEAEYREHLPVIEIDGIRAFTYFVSVDALLDRLDERLDLDPQQASGGDGSPERAGSGAGTM